MDQLLDFIHGEYSFPIMAFLLQGSGAVLLLLALVTLVYDRYIQRENQLLINYPLVGRLRYVFYALRDPMRQYFGDENFFDSFDKVKWVYNAAENKGLVSSFSPGQPLHGTRLTLKNANVVLNKEEVEEHFNVTFGSGVRFPFTAASVVGRSAMSDGAISPEGTKAFAWGAFLGNFPINTGEGSLTSNFLMTHRFDPKNFGYMEAERGTLFARSVYRIMRLLVNPAIAERVYRHMILAPKEEETYLFDPVSLNCYRIDWKAPMEAFPETVPGDLPDIIFQMGSGLYGVRDDEGEFDPERYCKVMRFCRMTEIKLAQGAKQTGGKLLAEKVTDAIAYYRGVEPYKDIFSPNRFPYAHTLEELFDFVGELKRLSEKPVGIKIVLASAEAFAAYAALIEVRLAAGSDAYPDFITVDGADGGSGAAPLAMMMSVGMTLHKALYVVDRDLKRIGAREKVKIIASEKVLTPDDATLLLALGADYVGIARAFMMTAGCIRARECSGANGRHCPVGLATQDRKKRASFLIEQKAHRVANYHRHMLEGIRGLMAVMGVRTREELDHTRLSVRDGDGGRNRNVDAYFEAAVTG
ncbi:glutamate synthase-related protein [Sulfurimonas sp. ST-25]|uniref:glutamate synthase-related protein n=1 Tax=Sulfurimonas sp. ST-25 TaxID=3400151 RepID=UPI003A85723C